jgi:hypothetical protein
VDDVGISNDIALGTDGSVHISYYSRSYGNLNYAVKPPRGIWQFGWVDRAGDVGRGNSLLLNSQNEPTIAYRDDSNGVLKFATLSRDGWRLEIWREWSNQDDGYSISLGSLSQFVHIIGARGPFAAAPSALQHVDLRPRPERRTLLHDNAFDASMAVDENGFAHVAYETYDGGVYYASNASGEWVHSQVSNDTGVGSSIATDGDGIPHIAYFEIGDYQVKYATRRLGQWDITTVDEEGGVPSLALGPSDAAHISYQKWSAGDWTLMYATNGSGEWITETADGSANELEGSSSIAVDTFGRPHISYYDSNAGDLKYATKVSLVIDRPR